MRDFSGCNRSTLPCEGKTRRIYRFNCYFWLTVIFLSIIIGCSGQNKKGTVVARVGNQTLYLEDIEALTSSEEERASAVAKREFVRQWIDTEVLYRQALRENLHQDIRLKRVIEQMEKELLAAELMEKRVGSQMAITNSEIEEYYLQHRDEFILVKPRLRARHILVNSREKATEIRNRLVNGEPFEELVRENTLDTETIDTDGDLGLFFRNEADPAIAEVAFSMEVGEFSPPVQTERGYHIIQVTTIQEEGTTLTLDEVWDEIANKIFTSKQRHAFDMLMKELKEHEQIEIYWDLIDSQNETSNNVKIKR
ncbi:MAG: peptidylprolyl isomerase [Gemmatimonadota bacterium]|nr:MAG: peptidylprolyl isomerase [Gemmatimonadota bacterium]